MKHMAFTDNFGNPKGLLGRLMLVSMDKEHLPMAEWGFTQFSIPEKADIRDFDCCHCLRSNHTTHKDCIHKVI